MGRKRELDRFDLEAEAEGCAIAGMVDAKPTVSGKKISKMRRQIKRGEEIQNTRIAKRYLTNH